jgi:hypothetical protein
LRRWRLFVAILLILLLIVESSMGTELPMEELFSQCEFNRLRAEKAWREYLEIDMKLFRIREYEQSWIQNRAAMIASGVKRRNYVNRKSALRNRRGVCFAIHRNACDAWAKTLEKIAEIQESGGEGWKHGTE